MSKRHVNPAPTSIRSNPTYLKDALTNDLSYLIGRFEKVAKKRARFDTIIGTGLSGAIVVPELARRLGLKWAIVRKQDGSHSPNKIEGEIGKAWLFVDDFVDSGATQQFVMDAVETFVSDYNKRIRTFNAINRKSKDDRLPIEQPFETQYVGTYEYYDEMLSDVPPNAQIHD